MQARPVQLHQGWTERKAGVREGLQELYASFIRSEFIIFLDKIIPLYFKNTICMALCMAYYPHVVRI